VPELEKGWCQMRFQDQVVIITGASSGIGWALAKEFARHGAKLGLLARRDEKLRQLSEEIRATGGIAEFAVTDVRERAPLGEAIVTLEAKLGPCDVLVANAGVGSTNTIDDLNVDGAETVIRVNLLGVVYSIEAVLPGMLKRGRGAVAALSSLASYKGIPSAAAYCASKAAVNSYMESLRIQLYGKGVSFTTICPGFIRTPMTESNKGMFLILEAQAAARKIVRAIGRQKKVFNFPWLTTRLMKLTFWAPDWLLHRAMPEQVGGKEGG
jgi:short-subunit dehydrogenase